MNQDILRTNMLAIVAAGLMVMVTGIIFYLLRDYINVNSRFFMPIPPLGVAAYIFVFNFFRHYEGTMPQNNWHAAREILIGTAVVALIFCIFTTLMVIMISAIKN